MTEMMESHEIAQVKSDLSIWDGKTFFAKYYLRSANWYFNEKMKLDAEMQHDMLGRLKLIIVDKLSVSFNNIQIVGSSMLGYSLAPGKAFRKFNETSDFDIALISPEHFSSVWTLFRHSYRTRYQRTYDHVMKSIYRGYIGEKDIMAVSGTRQYWEEIAQSSKKKIREDLGIPNEINYRLYRAWSDFEEYQLWSLKKLQRSWDDNTF